VPLGLVLLGPQALPPHVRAPGSAAAGLGLFVLGTGVALWAGHDLIVQGQGMPFPLDPTTELVTGGAYRYVRNPRGRRHDADGDRRGRGVQAAQARVTMPHADGLAVVLAQCAYLWDSG
jgi:hypothetical protein